MSDRQHSARFRKLQKSPVRFMLVKGLQFLKFIHGAGQALGCGHDAAN